MNSNEYTRCFIAFIDILGFKEKIKSDDCQDILNIYSDIKNPLVKAYIYDENGNPQLIEAVNDIKTKIMSDSICFYLEADKPDALFVLCACCSLFQAKLLKRSGPILLRGAIVEGDLFADGDITFGPGLTNAYLLEEKNAKTPRIIMTKQTFTQGKNILSRPNIAGGLDDFVFCDSDEYYVINCYRTLRGMNDHSNGSTSELEKHIEYILASTEDESVRGKYLYLKNNLKKYY